METRDEKPRGDEPPPAIYLKGLRFHGLTMGLVLTIFLSTLEISIVATALVTITDDLKNFERSSWIVTAYLLTYTGFLITWAKSSDLFGRKMSIMAAIIIFMVSSGACGAAQTTTQLILFRTFQGVGGSGMQAMTFVIVPDLVEAKRYAKIMTIFTITYAVSYAVGPLGGGALCDSGSWRWVFLLNVPAGFITLAIIYIFMPAGFPHTLEKISKTPIELQDIAKKIDFMGALLLFGSSILLVTALQEAGTQYKWSSPAIVVLLILAGVLGFAFLAWEKILNTTIKPQEPIFTWRLLRNRVFMATAATTFLAGVPFTVAIIQIPQRFQIVDNITGYQAGVRLLPFLFGASAGVILATVLASKAHMSPLSVTMLGAAIQVVATVLLSNLPEASGAKNYGYEALLAIGVGNTIGMIVLFTPQLITDDDRPVAMGAISQFRCLGGVVGLSIATTILNDHVQSSLSHTFAPEQLVALLQSVDIVRSFPAELQEAAKIAFTEGYNMQWRVMVGFASAQVVFCIMMWEKKIQVAV